MGSQGLTGNSKKTWFEIDGSLEPIDFDGPSYFRFPKELASIVIEENCSEGGWVFDPFAGFGTTLIAAQELGRQGIGFEYDKKRCLYANGKVKSPSKVIQDRIQNIDKHDLPEFDLIFTSPPYASFNSTENDPMQLYLKDFEEIFSNLRKYLKPGGRLILEVSNLKDDRGITPLAWHCGLILTKYMDFLGETIRCNSGSEIAGPGYDHAYLLHFKHSTKI